MTLLWIFLGGSIGAWARFRITTGVQRRVDRGARGAEIRFPWGTLAVNLLGSFLLGVGFAAAPAIALGADLRVAIEAGMLGAFTTFSTLAQETLGLAEVGRRRGAVGYALGSLVFGVLAWFAGVWWGGIGRGGV